MLVFPKTKMTKVRISQLERVTHRRRLFQAPPMRCSAGTRRDSVTSGDMTAFVNDLSYLVHRTTVESFADDFSGVSLDTAWSATGSYSVVGNTLNGTNAAGYLTATRTNSAPDSHLKVSVNKTSALIPSGSTPGRRIATARCGWRYRARRCRSSSAPAG
jgi:hypothetical protein